MKFVCLPTLSDQDQSGGGLLRGQEECAFR